MKISIVVISYNQEKEISGALDSLLNQTLKPFEIIVCDDCSSDKTWEVLLSYKNQYPNIIKPFRQQRNVGPASNLNTGLKLVNGDFVTIIAADDRFKPNKLEDEIKLLLERQVEWVYSQVEVIDLVTGKKFFRYKNPIEGYIFYKMPELLGIAPRNYLVRYNAWKKIGFFDETLNIYEDFDMTLRLAKFYKIAYNSKVSVEYRVSSKGLSKLPMELHLKNLQIIYSKLFLLTKDIDPKMKKVVLDKFRKKIKELELRNKISQKNVDIKDFFNFEVYKILAKKLWEIIANK